APHGRFHRARLTRPSVRRGNPPTDMGSCPQILPTRFVVDAPRRLFVRSQPGRKPRAGAIMRIDGNGAPGGTAHEELGETRDFCRATQTAESTFGRLVVNDGKLVSRLRDGAKITTGTLDKVRAYLSEHRPGQLTADMPAPVLKPLNGAATATAAAVTPPGF